MNKQEFLLNLRESLSGLPQDETEERLSFYSEMIDDRIEDGLSEEDAIIEIGSTEEIVSQIIADIPITKLVKERINRKRKIGAWEIVLLVLGAPIWISLLISLFAVILSLYVSLWSVIISLWAVFVSVIACAIGGIIAGIIFAVFSSNLTGIAMIGAGIVCGGLAIFAFFGCRAASKGMLLLTKRIAIGIKNCFVKKGEV